MRVFVTGTGGFIGFHLAQLLLREGALVAGYDAMTDYYDVALKQRRHAMLRQHGGFVATEARLEDAAALGVAVAAAAPDVIVHLAAQAGVRYSIEAPRAYVDANVTGTFHVMEAARAARVRHLLMASTSSVYGANTTMPYAEMQKADLQMSFYAATKKANEAMGHAWAHIHGLPTTMFRFFTVYGPWGRPDMALFRFTEAILEGRPIDVYNHGEMWRDFTYIDDLVRAIRLLIDTVPPHPAKAPHPAVPAPSGSAAALPARAHPAPGPAASPVPEPVALSDPTAASGRASAHHPAAGLEAPAGPAFGPESGPDSGSGFGPAPRGPAPGLAGASPASVRAGTPRSSNPNSGLNSGPSGPIPGDSLSPVAPFRIVNIGNSETVRLEAFIHAIEAATGRRAIRNYMDMQPGDVPATWADAGLLQALTGYAPRTDIREGVARFVQWYRDYYRK